MRINMFCRVATVILGCTLCALPAIAKTWHVPGDAATIKGGIALASSGDTVLVACGTYYEYDIRMKSGVCLRSETGDASCVTIDAQQQDNVIYCRFVASTARIEGFTITGGLAQGTMTDQRSGGGLCCLDNSSPTVENCTFTGDSADWNGGGVYCCYNSSPTFINCTISYNSASNGGSGMCFQDNSDPTMTDCTISDNFGTGIWTGNGASPTLTGCTFSGNSKSAIYCGYNGGHLTAIDCEFSSNTAGQGGGMRFWNSSATLTECEFSDNSASNGGALCLNDASVALINCSITGNSAYEGGGIYLNDSTQGASYLTADTTEFFDNTATNDGAHGLVGSGSELVLTCSVSDLSGFAGAGTIVLNYDGCFSPTKPVTWGRLKELYR
ncbi:MAG: right-handed parallel beta-helix repeat-containing protein [Candidatus Latescibacterota bacterium]|nr:MAG: right-handed parallel beta-helix repeat-containing protein [Candidatus Latescibacterota bacterium]